MDRLSRKAVAVFLSSALVVLAPGVEPWRAAAQTVLLPVEAPAAPVPGAAGTAVLETESASGPTILSSSLAPSFSVETPELSATGPAAPSAPRRGIAPPSAGLLTPTGTPPVRHPSPILTGDSIHEAAIDPRVATVGRIGRVRALETSDDGASRGRLGPTVDRTREPGVAVRATWDWKIVFDGAGTNYADDPETPQPAATPAPAGPSKARRALSILAKWTGLSTAWGVYRHGILMQRLADELSDAALASERRVEAARRLGELGRPEPVEVLGWAATHDETPAVRDAARAALTSLAAAKTPFWIDEMRLGVRPGARAAAARRLGWVARYSDDKSVVESLADAGAIDPSDEVKLTAVEALTRARSPKALGALRAMLGKATSPRLRSALEEAAEKLRGDLLAAGAAAALYRPPDDDFAGAKNPLRTTALKQVLGVSAVFVAVELVGGIVIGSLSLRADAMHLTADLAINAAALFSMWMARRPPNSRKTYGYLKMEALIGLLSAAAIALTAWEIGAAAFHRILAPVAVPALTTVLLATAGLASNLISSLILYRHRDEGLTLKGAFAHSFWDAVGSIGIMVSGFLMWRFGWFWPDPVICFVIIAFIAHTNWDLVKRSWNVLIDAVPPGVSLDAIETDLLKVPGLRAVTDLHVWSLNSMERAMTAHLLVAPGTDTLTILHQAQEIVKNAYKIGHVTFQIEPLETPPDAHRP